MRKLFILVLALTLTCGGISFAGLQIDQGQTRGQADSVTKFFVARNGRVASISADRVVVLDSTSNDGITVTTTTTSYDGLAVGVTIDAITGITSDNTAASGLNQNNWGRVQVYGRHASVSWDSGAVTCVAGTKVAAHSAAGVATILRRSAISDDAAAAGTGQYPNASRDSFGVTLEACAAGNSTIDIFLTRG